MQRLPRNFFEQDTVQIARALLGKILVFKNFKGIITETEAYRGEDDPASHAHRGPTPRTQVMFEKPGISYVYLIYGMYHCLNVVTEPEGVPGAVLIRGLRLLNPEPYILDGPGKLCRHLQITKEHHGMDLVNSDSFYITKMKFDNVTHTATPRIGIQKGQDKLWRFVLDNGQ